MKKQAICIQCHNCPEQINLLISQFPENDFDFFIHVDQKSNILKSIDKKSNITFVRRTNVNWGQFSQIHATLNILVSLDPEKYSYIHLISGNDFLIKSPSFFKNFFNNNHTEYIQCNPLPEGSTWSWGGADRYSVFYPKWIIKRPAHKITRIMRVLYREFVMRTKIFKRKNLPVLKFYGGSQWFSLTGPCVKWVKEYIYHHKNYVEFFKHGVCVDEIFFQTLVRISPFASHIVQDPLRYMDWEGNSTGGPKELPASESDKMILSHNIFARKITDLSTAKAIVEKLNFET